MTDTFATSTRARPEGIPQDFWEAAISVENSIGFESLEADRAIIALQLMAAYEVGWNKGVANATSYAERDRIARAIVAEREACAQVIENIPAPYSHPAGPLYRAGWAHAIMSAREAIRARGAI